MNSARGLVRRAPLRIALIATAAFALAYVLVASAAIAQVQTSGVAAVDQSLTFYKQQIQSEVVMGAFEGIRTEPGTVGWEGNDQGVVQPAIGTTVGSPPTLPTGTPTTVTIAGTPYRLLKFEVSSDTVSWIVLGESLTHTYARTLDLAIFSLVVAPFALAMVFLASWWIGRSAAAPAVRARERELAFTADASHELRTPLQVIEAESSLALLRDRPADAYRATIERISGESKRLRSIVDDLLWLARVEEEGDRIGGADPVDVGAIVRTTQERFASVAGRRGIVLQGHVLTADAGPLVVSSVEWLERLAGVLVDNAIRYTPDGGRIDLWTGTRSGRVILGVADTGPGVTEAEAQHIFERFHRGTDTPGGAGLGLAIADSIVRSSGGQWSVGRSEQLGGAQFEVSWPAARTPRAVSASATPASTV